VADADLVPQTIADALGVREQPGDPILATLIAYLRPRHLLLVLDNCEHLVDACAQVADPLLRGSPRLRILATSREALRIAGEVSWRVPSLEVPSERDLVPDELSRFAAVRLFVERAAAALPGFALTEENAGAVAGICQRLDGIPLAIELAAACVQGLAPDQIAARLDQRFRLLTEGSRTALPRHRTLRATVDWSYELLDPAERRLFARLGVFVGGFSLETAEFVGAETGANASGVLAVLLRLVSKSLVAAHEGGQRGSRYHLLETLRQYARERLAESGEVVAAERRHAAYFLARAEESEPKLFGPEQADWLGWFEQEHANLLAALRCCQERGGTELALRMVRALLWFWIVRGHLNEGRERLSELLARLGTAKPPTRARALEAAGTLAFYQRDYAAARALQEQGLAIWRELGDRDSTVGTLTILGVIAGQQGDDGSARQYLQETLAIHRAAGNRQGVCQALNDLAGLAHKQGDYAATRALYQESLAEARALGFGQGTAIVLHNLGTVAYEQGDIASARALHEESLALKRAAGDRRGMALSLMHLADVAAAAADEAAARDLLAESVAFQRELGDKVGVAMGLERLALLAVPSDPSRALRLAGAAAQLRAAVGSPLGPVARAQLEEKLGAAWRALGDDAARAAWEAGHRRTPEEIVRNLP